MTMRRPEMTGQEQKKRVSPSPVKIAGSMPTASCRNSRDLTDRLNKGVTHRCAWPMTSTSALTDPFQMDDVSETIPAHQLLVMLARCRHYRRYGGRAEKLADLKTWKIADTGKGNLK